MNVNGRYEKLFGIIADTHITVTEAMRLELKRWPVFGTIITFYDRPSHHFKSIGIEDKIEVFCSFDS